MPNADGSIIIKADVDDKDAEKRLTQLNKTIEKTEKELSKLQAKKLPIVEQANDLEGALDAAKYRLEYMQSGVEWFPDVSIKAQVEKVNSLQKSWDRVQDKLDPINDKIKNMTANLDAAKGEAGELEARMVSAGYRTQEAMNAAKKSVDKFTTRLKKLAKRVLVFSLFTMALRGLRDWFGGVIKTNEEATQAIARLRGALLTLAQPLINVLIPAFTAFLNVLTAIVGEIAKIVSGLFGATIEDSAKAAENLQKEKDALEGTGKAAKKAEKSLASFDEINKLSTPAAGSAQQESTAPDFSWADGVSEYLQKIAKAVLLIGAGLALWKISNKLPGTLSLVLSKLGGVLIAVGGLIIACQGLKDAWENGVDWGNVATMIAGVTAAAIGLSMVFGPIGAGIALVVGGLAMLVAGFRDVINNGANLQNTLLVIAGIIATGLGISLLVGSFIPLLVAGILAVIAAIVAWQGNLGDLATAFKNVFKGILDFFVGVFTGDMERAVKGLKNTFFGAINSIIVIFESLVNAIITGINKLINGANNLGSKFGISKSIPTISKVSLKRIPYLASGAVIPPNREFLAVLGDQTRGNNIETPEALLRKIVREEGGSHMSDAILRDILDAIRAGHVIAVDNVALGKVMQKTSYNTARASGTSLL